MIYNDIKKNTLAKIKEYNIKYLKKLYRPVGLLLIWSSIQFIIPRIYTIYCVPFSVWGYILTPIKISSIECNSLRWLLLYSANFLKLSKSIFILSILNFLKNQTK